MHLKQASLLSKEWGAPHYVNPLSLSTFLIF